MSDAEKLELGGQKIDGDDDVLLLNYRPKIWLSIHPMLSYADMHCSIWQDRKRQKGWNYIGLNID